jgi:hypothetical protein
LLLLLLFSSLLSTYIHPLLFRFNGNNPRQQFYIWSVR